MTMCIHIRLSNSAVLFKFTHVDFSNLGFYKQVNTTTFFLHNDFPLPFFADDQYITVRWPIIYLSITCNHSLKFDNLYIVNCQTVHFNLFVTYSSSISSGPSEELQGNKRVHRMHLVMLFGRKI